LPGHHQRVLAVVDNLNSHHARQVMMFILAHPRWEFFFLPTRTPYLNLIEPWWKVLRSIALKGHRFANWNELCDYVRAGTEYWNNHAHPFRWGRKRCKKRSCTIPSIPGIRFTG
jgi:transposase